MKNLVQWQQRLSIVLFPFVVSYLWRLLLFKLFSGNFRSFVRCPIIKVRKPSTEPLAAIAEPGGPWIQAVLPPSPGPVGANDLYSISEADIEAPSSEEPVL